MCFTARYSTKTEGLSWSSRQFIRRKNMRRWNICCFRVYTLPKGLSNQLMLKAERSVLEEEHLFRDYLPTELREKHQLCEYNYAIKQIHFPDDMETLIEARKRLVFDELFLFILNLQYQKEKKEKEKNQFSFQSDDFVEQLIEKLPYKLTNAQLRALSEVRAGHAERLRHAASDSGRCRFRKDDHCVFSDGGHCAQWLSVCDYGTDGGACKTALRIISEHV